MNIEITQDEAKLVIQMIDYVAIATGATQEQARLRQRLQMDLDETAPPQEQQEKGDRYITMRKVVTDLDRYADFVAKDFDMAKAVAELALTSKPLICWDAADVLNALPQSIKTELVSNEAWRQRMLLEWFMLHKSFYDSDQCQALYKLLSGEPPAKEEVRYDRVDLGSLSDPWKAGTLELLLNGDYKVGVSRTGEKGLELAQEESDHPYGVTIVNCLKDVVNTLNILEHLLKEHTASYKAPEQEIKL